MRCPYCKKTDDKVIDSRSSVDGVTIRRRRECLDCGRRFTTYEKVEEVPLLVIKKDQRREVYDRSKVLSGIQKACFPNSPNSFVKSGKKSYNIFPFGENHANLRLCL